jgi:hypothetical protein
VLAPDPPMTADMLAYPVDSVSKQFYFNDTLEVKFPAKKFPREYRRPANRGPKDQHVPPLLGMPLVTDITLDNHQPITVFENGSLAGGINLVTTYYWAWWEKMANMLPYDYAPGKETKALAR